MANTTNTIEATTLQIAEDFNETIEEAIQTYKSINSETLDANEKVKHIERHFELEECRKELREKL